MTTLRKLLWSLNRLSAFRSFLTMSEELTGLQYALWSQSPFGFPVISDLQMLGAKVEYQLRGVSIAFRLSGHF